MNILLTRECVRTHYLHHYETNDDAHQIDHADDVCDLMLHMNNELKLKIDISLIFIAAYTHDMFSDFVGRKNHHILAATYILNTKDNVLNTMEPFEKLCVAKAVSQHRASYKGEFDFLLCELLSSADRGKPNLDDIIKRSMKFNNGDYNETVKHIKDKFSRTGYAKYSDIYKDYFKDELGKLYDDIDNLKESDDS